MRRRTLTKCAKSWPNLRLQTKLCVVAQAVATSSEHRWTRNAHPHLQAFKLRCCLRVRRRLACHSVVVGTPACVISCSITQQKLMMQMKCTAVRLQYLVRPAWRCTDPTLLRVSLHDCMRPAAMVWIVSTQSQPPTSDVHSDSLKEMFCCRSMGAVELAICGRAAFGSYMAAVPGAGVNLRTRRFRGAAAHRPRLGQLFAEASNVGHGTE